MKKLIVLLVCCVVLSTVGCKTICPTIESSVIHDTVKTDRLVKIHDTVLKTVPVYIQAKIPLSQLNSKQPFKTILKKDKNAKLTADVVNDSLVMGCLCDTAKIKAQLYETFVKEYHSKNVLIKKPPIEVRYVPKLVKFLAITGGFFLLLVLILIIYNLYKKLHP